MSEASTDIGNELCTLKQALNSLKHIDLVRIIQKYIESLEEELNNSRLKIKSLEKENKCLKSKISQNIKVQESSALNTAKDFIKSIEKDKKKLNTFVKTAGSTSNFFEDIRNNLLEEPLIGLMQYCLKSNRKNSPSNINKLESLARKNTRIAMASERILQTSNISFRIGP